MVRAPFYDENGLKRGAWSEEEDYKLKDYIEKNGLCNWRELPRFAGLSRCGKSCRLRWMNYLRPDVKRGNYSKEEENLIINLHHKHGNKWSIIAAELPGRTDNEIKNYWHTHIKKLQKTKVIRRQDTKAFNSKTIRTRALAEPVPDPEPHHSILESFPLSSLIYESSKFVTRKSMDMFAKESPSPTLTFEALMDGDFWAQPFVPDKDINGFLPAAYELVYFDCDGEDLLYQAMKELPQNYQF